jgi:alginate O-acetyltransferase complex protein AlgI
MLFNSWHFVAFFILVIAVASSLPRCGTTWKVVIVGASCYFYGQWSWKYLSLIALTAGVDFSIARLMQHSRRPGALLALSVTANLGVLAFFKYANFLIDTANGVGHATSAVWSIAPLDIILPVGISFYTFQNMSYTIDVYRRELKPRASILDYATYTTFFPQLLAGPIVRASEFFAQLDRPRPIELRALQYALVLILAGYVKKIVLADNLAVSVDAVFNAPASASPSAALLAVYAFAFQIYFDFSGYTDIATGLALLLGFEFPKNFNYPYVATSFQDFWRRWHMTLSRWLRDYLYIALGGNRRGAVRTLANLMTTMLLGGLWHGASWTFIVWGGLHGVYLALERVVASRFAWWHSAHWLVATMRWLVVFNLICFAWIFFRAPDFASSMVVLERIAALRRGDSSQWQSAGLASLLLFVLVLHLGMARWRVKERLADANVLVFSSFAAAMMLALIWFAPAHTVPFIYFQF